MEDGALAFLGYVALVWLVVWMASSHRLGQFIIWLDQGLNIFIGSGWADETPSCYFKRRGGWREDATNILFFWQKDSFGRRDHCERALRAEKNRRHMPPELRDELIKELAT